MEINGHGIVKNPTEEGVSLTYIEGWEDAAEFQHDHDVEVVKGVPNPHPVGTFLHAEFEANRNSYLKALKADVQP